MANMKYPEFEYDNDHEYEDEDYEYADEGDSIDYYDDYHDYANGDEDDYNNGDSDMAAMSYKELWEYCVVPSAATTAVTVGALLAWVVVFTVSTRIVRIPGPLQHLLSCICGCGVLWQIFGPKSAYLAGQVVTGCLSVAAAVGAARQQWASQQTAAWLVALACIVYLLVCELWLVTASDWHSVRGAQMIILMKVISYAYDVTVDAGATKLRDAAPDAITTQPTAADQPDTESSVRAASGKHSKVLTETSGEQRLPADADSSNIIKNRKSKGKPLSAVDDTAVSSSKSETTRDYPQYTSSHAADKSSGVVQCRVTLYNVLAQCVELCGYLLHPGTVVFGPWCSLATYRQILEPMDWGVGWSVLMNLALSGAYVICSSCLVSWLIPSGAGRWVLAYRDALAFRLSHYFVSHLSEASAAVGGLRVGVVARAQYIEAPRSLLSVVTYWNIPMHTFLKKYVFQRVRSAVGGVWCAVLCTYAASAVIHGLNGQLCAVLLSLAVYTHAEHRLRCKLAKAFDACVLARACRQPCAVHGDKGYSGIVINLILSGLCVWHLAYLGVMFGAAPGSSSGYDISHTLAQWGRLHYASHWAVLATYAVTWLM